MEWFVKVIESSLLDNWETSSFAHIFDPLNLQAVEIVTVLWRIIATSFIDLRTHDKQYKKT